MNSKSTPLQDLGFANGWDEDPPVVQRCKELNHERNYKEAGRCLHEVQCDLCGYVYRYDSSD